MPAVKKVDQKKREGNALRQANLRDARVDAGLKEVRNLWAHPDDEKDIRKYTDRKNKARLAKGELKRLPDPVTPRR
jgi:hypothetical protein